MEATLISVLSIFLLCIFVVGLCLVVLLFSNRFGTKPIPIVCAEASDARTTHRISGRFGLLLTALLILNVELLFIFPWAAAARPTAMNVTSPAQAVKTGIDVAVSQGLLQSRDLIFFGAMAFIGLVALGFLYDWRKGVFRWR